MKFTNNQIISAIIAACLTALLWIPNHWVMKTATPVGNMSEGINMWEASEVFRWIWIALIVLVVLNILFDLTSRVVGVAVLFFAMGINYFLLQPAGIKLVNVFVEGFGGKSSIGPGLLGWASFAIIIFAALIIQSLDDADKISRQRDQFRDNKVMQEEGSSPVKKYHYEEPNFEEL